MATITINRPLAIMNVREITMEEAMNHPEKEYNEKVWKEIISRYAKQLQFGEVNFYERTDDCKTYDELYVEYSINEGIRFFNQISYASCLSSAGFLKVNIEGEEIITEYCFEEFLIANNREGRSWMADMSKKFGYVFSNALPISKTESFEFSY